jgi:hypothetical protein
MVTSSDGGPEEVDNYSTSDNESGNESEPEYRLVLEH